MTSSSCLKAAVTQQSCLLTLMDLSFRLSLSPPPSHSLSLSLYVSVFLGHSRTPNLSVCVFLIHSLSRILKSVSFYSSLSVSPLHTLFVSVSLMLRLSPSLLVPYFPSH